MTNKLVTVAIAKDSDIANDLSKVGKYVHNEVEYKFIEDTLIGYFDSELELKYDMILSTNPTFSGRLDAEFDRRVVVVPWLPKCKQQARLKKVLKNLKNYVNIPTTECDLNIKSLLDKYGSFFKTGQLRIKPINLANGDGQKVIDGDDPLVYRLRTRYCDAEFVKEHIGPEVMCGDNIRTLIAQPNLNILDEWRLIYLGDDFLVARRKLEDGKGSTSGLNDPYEHINSHDFECFVENDKVRSELYSICKRLKLQAGTSMDLALVDTEQGPKFTIIEYQPQFGTSELNWNLHDYCTEKYIEHVLEPRAKELGFI